MNESSTETATSSAQLTSAEMQLLATDEFSQYFLHAPSEMNSIFRSLAERVEQVSLIFNEGKDIVLSSLISYNAEGLILEYGANADINRRALQARRLFCVSQFAEKIPSFYFFTIVPLVPIHEHIKSYIE